MQLKKEERKFDNEKEIIKKDDEKKKKEETRKENIMPWHGSIFASVVWTYILNWKGRRE